MGFGVVSRFYGVHLWWVAKFIGIMLRAKGPYRTEWTDVPIEQQLQDGEFRWPKGIRFMGKLPDCWRWMFVGLLITIAFALIGIWKVGHP